MKHAQTSSDACKAPLELQAAAVKAVRQVFETISVPSVIDMVPGGIDKARAKVKVAVPYPVSPKHVVECCVRALRAMARSPGFAIPSTGLAGLHTAYCTGASVGAAASAHTYVSQARRMVSTSHSWRPLCPSSMWKSRRALHNATVPGELDCSVRFLYQAQLLKALKQVWRLTSEHDTPPCRS